VGSVIARGGVQQVGAVIVGIVDLEKRRGVGVRVGQMDELPGGVVLKTAGPGAGAGNALAHIDDAV
jgi:hypothetical protein